MRGLDPRIHSSVRANGGMDRRIKPGDDNREVDGARRPVKIPEKISWSGSGRARRPLSLS